jgi:hypothetical protein
VRVGLGAQSAIITSGLKDRRRLWILSHQLVGRHGDDGEGLSAQFARAGLPNPSHVARLFVRHRPSFANELRLAQWRTPIDLHRVLFAIKLIC